MDTAIFSSVYSFKDLSGSFGYYSLMLGPEMPIKKVQKIKRLLELKRKSDLQIAHDYTIKWYKKWKMKAFAISVPGKIPTLNKAQVLQWLVERSSSK